MNIFNWASSNGSKAKCRTILNTAYALHQPESLLVKINDRQAKEAESQRNWNRPINEDVGQSAASEPSHSSLLEGEGAPVSYINIPNQAPTMRSETVPAQSKNLSSPNRDDEVYFIPQSSVNLAPRMIQKTTGSGVTNNAFNRLKDMGAGAETDRLPDLPGPGDLGHNAYPVHNSNALSANTNNSRSRSRKTAGTKCLRLSCFVSSCMVALLIAVALTTTACAIIVIMTKDAECKPTGIYLILETICFAIAIFLEWLRTWIWREPSGNATSRSKTKSGDGSVGTMLPTMTNQPSPIYGPVTAYTPTNSTLSYMGRTYQPNVYEMPKLISGLFLIVVYAALAGTIIGTLGAAVPIDDPCKNISMVGIGFSCIAIFFLLLRLVSCCMGDVCYGIMKKSSRPSPVPMVSDNSLSHNLPGLSDRAVGNGVGHLLGGSNTNQSLSMVRPMPNIYGNEMKF